MYIMKTNTLIILCSIVFLQLLTGCASIGEGITRAILEQEKKDVRECHIKGPGFPGVRQSLESQGEGVRPDHKTKLLMVHGISKHLPGYSTSFQNKLMKKLNLTVTNKDYKEIKIIHPKFPDDEHIGIIRISRHLNADQTQELLFYELTWSSIADPEKKKLDFDSSSENVSQRALVNASLKEFINKTVPDLLIYKGKDKFKINISIGQGICTLFEKDWDDIPKESYHFCDSRKNDISKTILRDDFFYITHSLGSKIMSDTNQYISDISDDDPELGNTIIKNTLEAMRQKEIPIFMLSNQLPLLDLGEPDPTVINSYDEYCSVNAPKADERVFKSMIIVAFSDPNDVLSYPIPPRFIEENIDSRLCPRATNISIGVAEVMDIFGVGFANPHTAHTKYFEDDRVLSLITDGVSEDHMHPLIEERCDWVKTIE